MDRVLVTGATGFLGSRLVERLAESFQVFSTSRTEPPPGWPAEHRLVDLAETGRMISLLYTVRPDFIVHAAAMADVAQCEKEPLEAFEVNTAATRHLMSMAKDMGAPFVYISTDMVFDGESAPYKEEDTPTPASEYARTKVAAERAVAGAEGERVIFRAALLYDYPPVQTGNFFVRTMKRLAAGEAVDLFDDQWRTPLLSDDVARAIAAWYETEDRPITVFNLAGPERLSRYEMGLVLARELGAPEELVRPGKMEPGFAPRDLSLATGAVENRLGFEAAPFEEGVKKAVERFRASGG